MTRGLAACDDSALRIKQQIAHWEEKQVEVAQPKLSPELQAEIRAHMKTQNMEEKRAAVNGDVRVLGRSQRT